MSPKSKELDKVIYEYLEDFPEYPTLTIAKMICEDYPSMFNTLEDARQSVRYRRNERIERKAEKREKFERTPEQKKAALGTFKLPDSDYQKKDDYLIPVGNNRGLIMNDIHIPYHDMTALEAAITHGIDFKPNFIYLNGDTIDMYQASRFIKDRLKRDLAGELELTREFLRMLQDTFSCTIYFKMGNHEDRWEHYMMTKAPELLGIKDFKLSEVLRFGELGVQQVDSKQLCRMGNMIIMHGHEFGQSVFSPVNSARGLYMKAKANCAVGHHHQTSEHTEKDVNGNVVTTFSIGSLCGLSPDYFPYNKWNHGFATIETEPNGDYEFRNYRIINGKVQ
jgi:hypothetical protein